MARGKKTTKTLTLEEKLKQALVPEEEQPYKIPGNWCWVRVGNISSLYRGVSYKKNDVHTIKEDSDCLIMRGGNIGEGYIDIDVDNVYVSKSLVKDCQLVCQNDIVIVASTGSKKVIGRAGVSEMSYSDVSFGAFLMLVRSKDKFNAKYLDYFFQTDDYRTKIRNLVSGVNINNIRADYITSMPIPFPPLVEQQRIVTRIENLFSKLDEAKEKAQSVIDGFELRKSAILHKAFTGELTQRWRKEHGVRLESWETVTSKNLFEYVTSGSRGWAQYYSQSGAVFVRMGNLQHGTIELDMSSIQYVDLPDKAEGQRSLIKKNDILISITADVGMIGLVRDIDFEGYINQHVALARPAKSESAEFIAWYLTSDVGFKQFRKKQRGATKVGLGLNDIRTLCLDMPIIAEQKEILKILNKLMNKEHQAKQTAESVLAQIDTMKKAILARAFRGELGTNNPNDENAVELLKRVLAEKN